MLNFIAAVLLSAGLAAPVERFLPRLAKPILGVLAASGIGVALGSLTVLLVSEHTPIFGFMEVGYRQAIVVSIVLEAATALLLGASWSGSCANASRRDRAWRCRAERVVKARGSRRSGEGIEPSNPWAARPAGFEDRMGHQTPAAPPGEVTGRPRALCASRRASRLDGRPHVAGGATAAGLAGEDLAPRRPSRPRPARRTRRIVRHQAHVAGARIDAAVHKYVAAVELLERGHSQVELAPDDLVSTSRCANAISARGPELIDPSLERGPRRREEDGHVERAAELPLDDHVAGQRPRARPRSHPRRAREYDPGAGLDPELARQRRGAGARGHRPGPSVVVVISPAVLGRLAAPGAPDSSPYHQYDCCRRRTPGHAQSSR